ncbi:hypothetical protein [Fibrobacter sp.]|uniref:hypothetical protein n=1 Tax=Fibrobacter sp. TaxID=35828 RepID=UPI003890F9EF
MRKFTLFAILSVLAVLFIACDDSSSGASNADEQAEAISSESTTDEGISSAEEQVSYSSIAENEDSSSANDDTIIQSSSSEKIKESSSSKNVEKISSSNIDKIYSSEALSSSSATQSNSFDIGFYYFDQSIYQFNGDTSEVQKAGRFYVLYRGNKCPRKAEYDNLRDFGIEYWTKGCIEANSKLNQKLFRSTKDIKKHVLDSLIEVFFNSYTPDDTSKIEIEFDPRDWQETVRICDEEKNCHYETIEKDSVHLTIYFWEDVSAEGCEEVVSSCGVNALEPCPFYFIDVMAPKSSIECLETSRDIQDITPPQHGDVL